MRPNIRPMTAKDKAHVMAMLRNMPEFKPAEVAIAEEVLDSYLAEAVRSGYYIFVAEMDSQVIGYTCYGPTPLTQATWDIYWLAVSPKRQSQGIGKHLLSSAEKEIKGNNGKMAVVETSSVPKYEATRRFYLAQGYELTCRIADFYATGDDKLIFIKRFT
jgi:ribosomal protein S18 acetylase RimI-like enzyme